MAETFIDLDALLGGTPRYTRTVHGRQVTLDDIDFQDMPALVQRYGSLTFTNVYASVKDILGKAEVEPPLDDAWLGSLPFGEATALVIWQMNPTADDDREPETPVALKLKGLELTLPPFTLDDAKYFSERVYGHEATVDRLTHILDRVTLKDGSPLPDGFMAGLKQSQVQALITAYINRSYERAEKNVETPETGGDNKRGSMRKSSRK